MNSACKMFILIRIRFTFTDVVTDTNIYLGYPIDSNIDEERTITRTVRVTMICRAYMETNTIRLPIQERKQQQQQLKREEVKAKKKKCIIFSRSFDNRALASYILNIHQNITYILTIRSSIFLTLLLSSSSLHQYTIHRYALNFQH